MGTTAQLELNQRRGMSRRVNRSAFSPPPLSAGRRLHHLPTLETLDIPGIPLSHSDTRPRRKCRYESAGSWVLILPGVQIIICVLDTFVSSPTRKKTHKKIQHALQKFHVPQCEVRVVDVEDCKKG